MHKSKQIPIATIHPIRKSLCLYADNCWDSVYSVLQIAYRQHHIGTFVLPIFPILFETSEFFSSSTMIPAVYNPPVVQVKVALPVDPPLSRSSGEDQQS